MNPGEGIPPKRKIDHRRVDREGGLVITEIPEKTLLARGFEYVGTKMDDESILAEGPLSGSLMGFTQKDDEFRMSREGATKLRNAFFLREYVEHSRLAGYDVRLVKAPGINYFRVYRRFDLDRFITRMPEDRMGIEEYSLKTKPFRFHKWGDTLEDCAVEEWEQFRKENDEIKKYVEDCIAQNFQVQFIEKRRDNEFVLLPYTRPKNREGTKVPFEVHRPLNGITTESSDVLLRRGFTFDKNTLDDGSLSRDPILALDSAYLAALDTLSSSGIFVAPKNFKKLASLREEIILAASKGVEIRVVKGVYDSRQGSTIDVPDRFAVFSRFDLARFIKPPDTLPQDLLDQGFEFKGFFPLMRWGDFTNTDAGLLKKVRIQREVIEVYIRKQEARGLRVRCLVGRFFPESGIHKPQPTFLSVFTQKKRYDS